MRTRRRFDNVGRRPSGLTGGSWSPVVLPSFVDAWRGVDLAGAAGADVAAWTGINGHTFDQFVGTVAAKVVVTSGKKGMRLAESSGTGTGNGYGTIALSGGAMTIALCTTCRSPGNRILQAGPFTGFNGLSQPRRGFYAEGWVVNTGLPATSGPYTFIATKSSGGNWAVYLDGTGVAVNANTTDWPNVCIGAHPIYDEVADADVWSIVLTNGAAGDHIGLLHQYMIALAP